MIDGLKDAIAEQIGMLHSQVETLQCSIAHLERLVKLQAEAEHQPNLPALGDADAKP